MADVQQKQQILALTPEVAAVLYEALMFARDEYLDGNGLPFSNEESEILANVIDEVQACGVVAHVCDQCRANGPGSCGARV